MRTRRPFSSGAVLNCIVSVEPSALSIRYRYTVAAASPSSTNDAQSHSDRAGAIEILQQAAERARQQDRRIQLESLLGEWADIVAEEGDHARAYELSREALAVSRTRSAS